MSLKLVRLTPLEIYLYIKQGYYIRQRNRLLDRSDWMSNRFQSKLAKIDAKLAKIEGRLLRPLRQEIKDFIKEAKNDSEKI